MYKDKLYSEPTDFYIEKDGDVLPPESEPVLDPFLESKHRGETVARAYLEHNDKLTRQVYPSIEMDKAYQISRKILELNDHDFEINKNHPSDTQKNKIEVKEDLPEEVKYSIVGKYGNKMRGEYMGRVVIIKIPLDQDTDAGHEIIRQRIEEILKNGGGRKVPKKN